MSVKGEATLTAVSIPSTTTSMDLANKLGMSEIKVKRLVRKHGVPYFTKDGYYVLGETALDELVASMLRPAPVRKTAARIEGAAAETVATTNKAVAKRKETRKKNKEAEAKGQTKKPAA